jgi:hypothetical protein
MYRTILAVTASAVTAFVAPYALTYFVLCPLIFG